MEKLNRILCAFILFLLGAASLTQILLPVTEYTDSLSLFNPVYMYAKYKKMVYPIHGYFDNMPVHPPLFYLIQGILYRIFNSAYWACKLPALIIYLYFYSSTILSRLSINEKIVWLLSCYLITPLAMISLRPDFILALCFITGLFHFEAARKGQSIYPNVFLGSIFLSLTSVLHYFGSFAFFGTLVYAYYFYTRLPKIQVRRVLCWSLLPTAIIISSYLLIQVIPNIHDIWRQIHGVNNIGDPLYSIKIHHLYGFSPFIPLCVLSIIFVFLNRDSLYLYLSSLPITLFVLLFCSGKSQDYYLPEYFTFAILASLFINNSIKIKSIRFSINILLTVFLFDTLSTALNPPSNTNNIDAALMRKVSQYMYGDNKIIASRMDLWYISGTRHYLNLNPLIIWNNSEIKNTDTTWLSNFDYIAEHNFRSDYTTNKHLTTISGIYLSNALSLAGYNCYQNTTANTMFYSRSKQPFKSIVFETDSCLVGYEDSTLPEAYFISFIIDSENIPLLENTPLQFYTPVPLVNSSGTPNQNEPNEYLIFGYVTANIWESKTVNPPYIKYIKDAIPISWEHIPIKEIEKINTNDVLIYDSLENLQNGTPYY